MPTVISGTTGVSQVQDGIITDADINTSANIAGSKIVLALSSVTTQTIANSAVTAAKMSGGQTGSAPVYGCRAWVNFDGTRDTTGAASSANTNRFIRTSGNVSSVLRNASGDYTVTFTTAMADADFAFVASINSIATNNGTVIAAKYATTASSISFRIQSTANPNLLTYFDMGDVCVAIFR